MACFQSRVGVKKSMETDKVDSADPNLGYHNPVTEPQLKMHFLPPLPALRTRNPTTHYLVEGQIHRGWNLLGAAMGFTPVL